MGQTSEEKKIEFPLASSVSFPLNERDALKIQNFRHASKGEYDIASRDTRHSYSSTSQFKVERARTCGFHGTTTAFYLSP